MSDLTGPLILALQISDGSSCDILLFAFSGVNKILLTFP